MRTSLLLGWDGEVQMYVIVSLLMSHMRNLGVVVLLSREAARSTANAGSLSQPMVVLQILSYVSWINPLPIQVWPKNRTSRAHTVGPGVEMRDDPVERRRRNNSLDRDRRSASSLE